VTVPEARLERTDAGLVPADDGWFVLNLDEAAAIRLRRMGAFLPLEGPGGFPDFGFGVHVLRPGQPNGLYHEEAVQETFLVVHGECLLIVEEQERRLRTWDLVHCPAGTRHIFVGAGDGPCAIVMAGARRPGRALHYPVSEVAARHGASAARPTDWAAEAYDPADRVQVRERLPWPL